MSCRCAQAIWFSASKDLSEDARRDFRDIGALKYDPVRIHNLRSVLSKAQWGALSKAPGDEINLRHDAEFDAVCTNSLVISPCPAPQCQTTEMIRWNCELPSS